MQRPSFKWVLIFNLVLDIPMAIIMSVSANLLAHFGPEKAPIVPQALLMNILIGFVLAFIINVILPIPKISAGFAGLFGIKPHTIAESLVGGLPVCLIFTVGIGAPLTAFNLAMANNLGNFMPAFLGTFLPLYVILYIVAFIMTPIAATVATNACKK